MKNKMRMLCLMQENGHSDQEIKQLERAANKLYKKHFGEKYSLLPVWVVVPRGQAFLAAQPSTTTTVTMPVENHIENDVRHPFMYEFCQMWMDITQCHQNEIILNVTDRKVAEEFAKKTVGRINPTTRFYHVGKQLTKLVKSKVLNGYYSMNFNFDR
ncbi:MAG: hypothetical protein MI867_20835 [Pseudomonadales bacterium]|nr:hypothetical protein [Pseudomonadales bacterium]